MNIYAAHTDDQLLNLLKESNEAAFKEIYSRYWKRMYAMAFLRLQRTDIAEDIVQDIFTYLWQGRQKLCIATLEQWLATAVKYKIITLINRRLKKELSSVVIPEQSYNDTLLDERLLEQLVQTEINRLPPMCRLVFRFSREHNLSNSEIAVQLNISEKAVEKHITRARRELSLNLRNLLQSLFSFLF